MLGGTIRRSIMILKEKCFKMMPRYTYFSFYEYVLLRECVSVFWTDVEIRVRNKETIGSGRGKVRKRNNSVLLPTESNFSVYSLETKTHLNDRMYAFFGAGCACAWCVCR